MAFRSGKLQNVVHEGVTVERNGFFLHIGSIFGNAVEQQFSDEGPLNPETWFG